jgi:hypothetical protein
MVRLRRAVPLSSILFVCALALTACGGTPEAPEWDIAVAAPFSSERLAISDFLPAGVDTAQVNGEKIFTLPAIRNGFDLQLDSICPVCAGGGITPLIPAFSFGGDFDVALPTNLVRMEVNAAQVAIAISNGLGFPMLGSTGDGSGFLEIVILDQGTGNEIGRQRREGPGSEINPGETATMLIDLVEIEITDGITVQFTVSSPQITLPAPISLNPAASLGFAGELGSLRIGGLIARVDAIGLTKSSPIDMNLDEGTRDQIDNRLIGADVEFQLLHNVAITGPFAVTIANSEATLYSGNPLVEIPLGQFSFAPDLIQTGSLDASQVQQLIEFDEHWIGYEAVGTGTLSEPPGHGPLSRFTPDTAFQTRVKVAARFRVGG